MRINSVQFDLHEPVEIKLFVFVTLIIYKILPGRIHRLGSVCLRHLGEIVVSKVCADSTEPNLVSGRTKDGRDAGKAQAY